MKNLLRALSFVAFVAFFSSCTEEVKPAAKAPTLADPGPPKNPCSGGGTC